MGSVSGTNTLPEPSVAAPEGTVPVSGVAVEALAEAEQKTPETVDASNPPEEGSAEPAAKRQKLTLEEQCERLVTFNVLVHCVLQGSSLCTFSILARTFICAFIPHIDVWGFCF